MADLETLSKNLNMKNNKWLAGFVLLCGCVNATPFNETILPAPNEMVVPTIISNTRPKLNPNNIVGDNWQLTLSGSGWQKEQPTNDGIKAAYSNSGKECSVMFIKNETDLSLMDYVISLVVTLKNFGIDAPEITDIKINDLNAILITARLSGKTMYIWAITKNGFGYGFSCGGAIDSTLVNRELKFCSDMASSIEIK